MRGRGVLMSGFGWVAIVILQCGMQVLQFFVSYSIVVRENLTSLHHTQTQLFGAGDAAAVEVRWKCSRGGAQQRSLTSLKTVTLASYTTKL